MKIYVLFAVQAALLLGACAQAPITQTSKPRLGSDGPLILERVPPQYPRVAAKDRIEGCATVSFVIAADGRADQFEVVDSVPKGVFEKATLAALYKWRFEVPMDSTRRYAQLLEYTLEPRGKPVESKCLTPAEYEGRLAQRQP